MKTLEQLGISPAPWYIEKNTGVLCAKSERYKHPIVDDYGNFENNNDKLLIAAAPDMYKTEYELVDVIERLMNGWAGTCDVPSQDAVVAAIEAAKKALAKAAGESEAER